MNRGRLIVLYLIGLFTANIIVILLVKEEANVKIEVADVGAPTAASTAPIVSNQTRIVFMVISKHTNYDKRTTIRSTWKSNVDKLPDCRVFFFVAADDADVKSPEKLKDEIATYNDVVVLNMTEKYLEVEMNAFFAKFFVFHKNNLVHSASNKTYTKT